MGSKGSLHFRTNETNDVVATICSLYEDPATGLNQDPSHNGRGKPILVIGELFTSLYDGSFAVYGDLYEEAKLLSIALNRSVMGVTNANDDMTGLFIAEGREITMDALLIEDEWVTEGEASVLIEKLALPYLLEEIQQIFSATYADELITSFHQVMNLPYFIATQDTLSRNCRLEKEAPHVVVYRQFAPYQWDEDYDYPV